MTTDESREAQCFRADRRSSRHGGEKSVLLGTPRRQIQRNHSPSVRSTMIVDCAGIESPATLTNTSELSNVTVTPLRVVARSKTAPMITGDVVPLSGMLEKANAYPLNKPGNACAPDKYSILRDVVAMSMFASITLGPVAAIAGNSTPGPTVAVRVVLARFEALGGAVQQ